MILREFLVTFFKKISLLLESIKFTHTVFAMPFALLSALLARRGSLPSAWEFLCIIVAMVGARTWAMSVNRLVDHQIDAQNPRTQNRALPMGTLSRRAFFVLAFVSACLLCLGAAGLSSLSLGLSFPLLLVLASYSYFKRWSAFCHFWLGFCLACAPAGAWIALTNTFDPSLLWLCAGILFWVSGFDIIYAIQDYEFDSKRGLHSVPVFWGKKRARYLAFLCHVLSVGFFYGFGVVFYLGKTYFWGLILSAILIFSQHLMLRLRPADPLSEAAFFRLNGWVAVLLFLASAWQFYLKSA